MTRLVPPAHLSGAPMPYHENVLSAISAMLLVRLNKVVEPAGATVLAKLEFVNPGGSIKDRMAIYIERAEKAGLLRKGGTIVENTSGNTGVGLAIAAAVKGYRCVFTMPDKMSKEKQDTLKAFGAQVVVTPTNVPADSPESYYSVAKRIAAETPNSFDAVTSITPRTTSRPTIAPPGRKIGSRRKAASTLSSRDSAPGGP